MPFASALTACTYDCIHASVSLVSIAYHDSSMTLSLSHLIISHTNYTLYSISNFILDLIETRSLIIIITTLSSWTTIPSRIISLALPNLSFSCFKLSSKYLSCSLALNHCHLHLQSYYVKCASSLVSRSRYQLSVLQAARLLYLSIGIYLPIS